MAQCAAPLACHNAFLALHGYREGDAGDEKLPAAAGVFGLAMLAACSETAGGRF